MQGQWLLLLDHYLLIPQSPTFNQIERGHRSEGRVSDIDSQRACVFKGYTDVTPHYQCTIRWC